MRTSRLIPIQGGAKAIVYGNLIYTVGYIFIAASTTIRNYKFMVFGTVVSALGDIATQVAQYKIFSSWFPPNNGFASTLGLELGIGKVCASFRASMLILLKHESRSVHSSASHQPTSLQR